VTDSAPASSLAPDALPETAAPATPQVPGRRYDRSIVEGPLKGVIWKLAWPTMLTNIFGGIQGMVDHIMVGHYVGYAGNAAIGSPLSS
jgi:hypothetical protein